MRHRIFLMAATLGLAAIGGPSLAQHRDPFGPRPQFDWINAGESRPTPRIAETAIGIEPMPVLSVTGTPGTRGSVTRLGPSPSECYNDIQPIACLRRNWLAVLGVLGEGELSAPAGGRSYRLLLFPSFAPWVSVRLDVRADGGGVMTISRASENTLEGAKPLGRRSKSIDAKDVDAVEADFEGGGFEHLSPEPEPSAIVCLDGSDMVLEAVVGGRYRYVARHSCQSDFDFIWKMTAQIRTAAGLVDPLRPRPRGQASQN